MIEYVRIRSARKLIAELRHEGYIDEIHSAAVFCTDEPVKEAASLKMPHCCVQFTDTEAYWEIDSFQEEQAEYIRDFLFNLPDGITTLYCCCDWGQSRSAGLAAACMNYLGQNYRSIFGNDAYYPNLLVYAYMCKALGVGSPLVGELDELRKLRSHAGVGGMGTGLFSSAERIVLAGDTSLCERGEDELPENLLWPSLLDKSLSLPVVYCGRMGKRVPCSEKELLEDRGEMKQIRPSDLTVVMSGISDIVALTKQTRETDYSMTAALETAAKMRKYILWLKYVYPRIMLVLISPPAIFIDNHYVRGEVTSLSALYRETAADLKIVFLDAGEWDYPPDRNDGFRCADIHRAFAENLARCLYELGVT